MSDSILIPAAARNDNPRVRAWLIEHLEEAWRGEPVAYGAYAAALYLSEKDPRFAEYLADYIKRVPAEWARGDGTIVSYSKRALIAFMVRDAGPWDKKFGTTSADNKLIQSQYAATRDEVVTAGYGALLEDGLSLQKIRVAQIALVKSDPFSNRGARRIVTDKDPSLQKIILDLAILAVLEETVVSLNVPALNSAYFAKERKYIILGSAFNETSDPDASLINGRMHYRDGPYVSLLMDESHELMHRMLDSMGFDGDALVVKEIHEMSADTAQFYMGSWLLGMHDGAPADANDAMVKADKLGYEWDGIKEALSRAAQTGSFSELHVGARTVIKWLIEEARSNEHPVVWKHLLQAELETVAGYIKRNVETPSFRVFVTDVLGRYVRIIDPDASLIDPGITDDKKSPLEPGHERLPTPAEIRAFLMVIDQGARGKNSAVRPSNGVSSSPGASIRPVAADGRRQSGGIDFTQIELTLANEEALAGMNAADRKILRAAKALKDGWDSLAVLYAYEAAEMVKEHIVKESRYARVFEETMAGLTSAGRYSFNESLIPRVLPPFKSY